MGNSYTRQAGASNIANGNIIDATDLNSEFDALDSAFNSSTGHTHDSSGNGAPIVKTGPGLEFIFNAGNVTPKTSGTNLDIGTSSLKFNNANFKGTVTAPTFTATSGATIPSLTVGSSTAVTSVDNDLSGVSANHDTLASAKAIKTYIDSQVTAQDLDISDGSNTGSIDLDSQSLTFTGSTGITATVSNQTVTISTDDSAILHDSLSGFVAAEHVDHSGVSITAGNGLTGGGTIESTRSLAVGAGTGIAVNANDVALSHLGLESLADPNADRVAFWDDSEGAFKWLTMGSNLSITDTTLNATITAGTDIDITNGQVSIESELNGVTSIVPPASTGFSMDVDGALTIEGDSLQLNVDDGTTVRSVFKADGSTDDTYILANSASGGQVYLGNAGTEQRIHFDFADSSTTKIYTKDNHSLTIFPGGDPFTRTSGSYLLDAGGSIRLKGTGITFDSTGNDFLFHNGNSGDEFKITLYDEAGGIAGTSDVLFQNSNGQMYFRCWDGSNPKFSFSNPTSAAAARDVDLELYNVDTRAFPSTIGSIYFQMNNDAAEIINYAYVQGLRSDDTDGAEKGFIKIGVFGQLILEGSSGGYYGDDTKLSAADDVLIYTNGSTLNSTFNDTNLTVVGALSKGSGSFKIDHPLPAKTETHHLVHSFIEGPQADLIYRGRAELVDGTATVNIDTAAGMTEGTFVVLCGDVQCFTSNESGWTAVKGSVSGNTLTITAQDNTCTDTISWMVVGERKDQHMIDTDWTDSEGHVIVEPEKPV